LFARALYSSRTDFLPFKYELTAFWSTFNIDCMAIGGFFAMLYHAQAPLLRLFQNKYLFYFALAFASLMIYQGIYFPILMVNDIKFEYLFKEFYAVWFGIIILNFATNRDIRISLESKVLRYLGKISYGLYMYHPICIVIVMNIALAFKQTSDWALYPLTLLAVILVAGASYKYFESYFLKFKQKFSTILSGENPSPPGA
jgi:peptidoglycan/LPS O-acetylase OafA/YrhL